jgi:hypothetical protein
VTAGVTVEVTARGTPERTAMPLLFGPGVVGSEDSSGERRNRDKVVASATCGNGLYGGLSCDAARQHVSSCRRSYVAYRCFGQRWRSPDGAVNSGVASAAEKSLSRRAFVK